MNFYDSCAQILEKLKMQKSTIKSLILSNNHIKDKKSTYAIICESLKYKEAIDHIINASELIKSTKLPPWIAFLLVYDLLFGKAKGNIKRNGGKYAKIIMKYKTRLDAELARLKIQRKISKNSDLIPLHIRNGIQLPKYIRVNTLKICMDDALNHFLKKGFKKVETLKEMNAKSFLIDKDVPNLLIFSHSLDLHKDEFFLNGSIIIQDKASCFPAFILNPPLHSFVLDACAAPGNKTSHLSAIMQNTGKIYAFDMDARRLGTLNKLTTLAGCQNITAKCQNFLQVNPKDYSDVEYVLLDPSCSGSGIVGRLDDLLKPLEEEEEDSEEIPKSKRLESLAEFQKNAIRHAFKFPNVKKVVYSTCSIHQQENELVVKSILDSQKEFVLLENIFEKWNTRGNLDEWNGNPHVIRTDPQQHHTIGFFVAVFVRQ